MKLPLRVPGEGTMNPETQARPSVAGHGLARRDVLKLGLGFSLALGLGTALVGCSDSAKAPVAGLRFLRAGDAELFQALLPAVAVEFGRIDAAQRTPLMERVLRHVDGTCAALGQGAQKELRKLLDLLAITPLRYALTGVGGWDGAGVEAMQAFLARWRGSRFATLNAGGNILVTLTASAFYMQPESWPSAGYPGPLDYVFKAVNS
jgi:hypothetical protein